MNLIVDVGNTRTKVAVFDEGVLLEQWSFSVLTKDEIAIIKSKYPITRVIVSQVGAALDYDSLFGDVPYILLSSTLKLPITNQYKTPNTLGADRIAGVVGAMELFPNQNNLVIDLGTCITFDFVTKDKEYKGGAILPGISMKFRALNTFTSKLPLLKPENIDVGIIGNDTQSSICSGVLNGTCFELEGFVKKYAEMFPPINVIFTGGDVVYFEKRVNFPNNVCSNLLLIGLNKILNENE